MFLITRCSSSLIISIIMNHHHQHPSPPVTTSDHHHQQHHHWSQPPTKFIWCSNFWNLDLIFQWFLEFLFTFPESCECWFLNFLNLVNVDFWIYRQILWMLIYCFKHFFDFWVVFSSNCFNFDTLFPSNVGLSDKKVGMG